MIATVAATDEDWASPENEVRDMLALRFPSWKQWERDEFAHRIEGIIAARLAAALAASRPPRGVEAASRP